MDGLALVAVMHVAVAADRRVGRPLVAGDAHEPARLVELLRQRVELAPERAGDLEVVALVADDVEEGLVAAELEIFARRVGAERLVGLAVRVAPEVHQRQCPRPRRAGDWPGTAPPRSRRARGWRHRPARSTRRPSAIAAKAPGAKRRLCRQTRNRHVGLEPQRAIDEVGGIAPLVVGLDRQAERLACAHKRRQHGAPAHARPRHDGDLRALRQRHVVVGGDRIGEDAELELALAIGLHADAGRAEAAVAEADGDGVAGREEVLDHADVERAASRGGCCA